MFSMFALISDTVFSTATVGLDLELTGDYRHGFWGISGGQRKRVNLGQEMLTRTTRVLFLDEPTTGLDPVVADSIDQLVIRMRDQLKCTSIVVTHDTRSMRRVGNRVMLLHHGRIHANGTPDDIFNSTDPIVHKFVNGIADPKDLEF